MTADEIYAELTAAFQEASGLSGNCSTELSIRFYAVAAQIEALYSQCVWVREQCFPQTAAETYLDYHAALRGLSRREAVRAEGTLRFLVNAAATIDLSISAGTVCMTAGQVAFETTEEAVLTAGDTYIDVPAQAVEPGAAGNVEAGTILSMSTAPVGISACTNPAAFTGGVDEEDDDTLRARVLDAYANMSNGANIAYYYQTAMGFEGVSAVQVLGRHRGIGTVDVIIAGTSGVPEDSLIAEVQACFDEAREIAVDVQVSAPTTTAVNVTVLLQASDNADYDTVAAGVQEALEAFFDGTLLGKSVLLAQLGAVIYAVDGVENYRITAPGADVAASHGVLPVLGTLTLTEWSGDA
ncbi:MAG: baseplate J/gp47 family protein [Oscillospiraceae bacterium]|nr:baseplate J/gp47 family protein [Oscillospiraceae bacterium]